MERWRCDAAPECITRAKLGTVQRSVSERAQRQVLLCVCRRVSERDGDTRLPFPHCHGVHLDKCTQAEDHVSHMASLEEVTPSADGAGSPSVVQEAQGGRAGCQAAQRCRFPLPLLAALLWDLQPDPVLGELLNQYPCWIKGSLTGSQVMLTGCLQWPFWQEDLQPCCREGRSGCGFHTSEKRN